MPLFRRFRRFQEHYSAGVAAGFAAPASTSLYFGRWAIFNPSASYATHSQEVQEPSMAITGVHFVNIVTATSAGPSTALATVSIWKNDTQAFTVGTVAFTTPGNSVENSTMYVPLTPDDSWVIKIATPAWSTSPNACYVAAQVFFAEPA